MDRGVQILDCRFFQLKRRLCGWRGLGIHLLLPTFFPNRCPRAGRRGGSVTEVN
jgi:hypothetical protein